MGVDNQNHPISPFTNEARFATFMPRHLIEWTLIFRSRDRSAREESFLVDQLDKIQLRQVGWPIFEFLIASQLS